MSSTTPRRGRRAPTHEHTLRAVRTRVVVSSVYATVCSVTLARAPARAGAWARRAPRVPAWTVKASEISHSGRGYLEHPSQWRRALWPGLLLYHPLLPPRGCTPPTATRRALRRRRSRAGALPIGHFDHAVPPVEARRWQLSPRRHATLVSEGDGVPG